jgi:hypothetical protein
MNWIKWHKFAQMGSPTSMAGSIIAKKAFVAVQPVDSGRPCLDQHTKILSETGSDIPSGSR